MTPGSSFIGMGVALAPAAPLGAGGVLPTSAVIVRSSRSANDVHDISP
jgi:hypothetical protein